MNDHRLERCGEAEEASSESMRSGRRLRLATLGLFATALAALVPTVDDLGLTWDEPAYRYSQLMSGQWWKGWASVRSWDDVQSLLDPSTLLFHWPYGRIGVNLHPPLAGQLNLGAFTVFGRWMEDIPARRMATVIEFALTLAIGFHFLARRYGGMVGVVTAGSLTFMPRLFGQAHLIDTDTLGLLLWAATAIAFWKGLHQPNGRRWRVLVGVLIGLGFIEKMSAVMVLLPLLAWLATARLIPAILRPSRAEWIDGLATSGAMLAPLALAFWQIQIIERQLLSSQDAFLFLNVRSNSPGAILAIPLAFWFNRRGLDRHFHGSRVWGAERPALETWLAILAFAPVIAWLGNPAWWRETLPRIAHYYMLSTNRNGLLPPMRIIYFGHIYNFSLPWHNAFVLLAITVPVPILAAAAFGLVRAILRIRHDRLPFYFLVHFLTIPLVRAFPTPAHDGVRLFLPTFFFLAAFAAWGTIGAADALGRAIAIPGARPWSRLVLSAAILGPSAIALVRIHPYELSYYNGLVGGPRGAWERGFELTYWYDAFNRQVIDDLNRRLPANAQVDFIDQETDAKVGVFQEQQTLGILRRDIVLGRTGTPFPYVWLLTRDSNATAFTRLLFAMRPWYASAPRQLNGARVASVCDPVAVSRAWALYVLLDAGEVSLPNPPAASGLGRNFVPWLGRRWGQALLAARDPGNPLRRTNVDLPRINTYVLDWSQSDPEGLLAAAHRLSERRSVEGDNGARRLFTLMTPPAPKSQQSRYDLTQQLLTARPVALVEAVQILNAHCDEVVEIMSRSSYSDPLRIRGYLDRDVSQVQGP